MERHPRTWQKTALNFAVNGLRVAGALSFVGGTYAAINYGLGRMTESPKFYPPQFPSNIQEDINTGQATVNLISENNPWQGGNDIGIYTLADNKTGETSLYVTIHKPGERGTTYPGIDFITSKVVAINAIDAYDAQGNLTNDQYITVEQMSDDNTSVTLQLIKISPGLQPLYNPQFDAYQPITFTQEQGNQDVIRQFGAEGLQETTLPVAWNMHIDTDTTNGHQHLVGAWFTDGYYPGDAAANNPHQAGENFDIDLRTLPIKERMVDTAKQFMYVGGRPGFSSPLRRV